ncbi:hypothetical protein SAMN05192569_10708 [Parageobacillus thermantarcticus]|uniref:Uncharacterized protein n=1 Tax=Parageobacillus thermantarcticus TaxID=186116 RepID=A0A1I0TWJ8_9BACL|nr:hypothetical protein SAMN05192569_10708 [Parageobacillus thermantarcticus]
MVNGQNLSCSILKFDLNKRLNSIIQKINNNLLFFYENARLERPFSCPGGEQKLLMELFRENPHHLVSAVYAPDPCGYTENGQKRQ